MKTLSHSTPLSIKLLLISAVLIITLLGMLTQPTISSYDPALYSLPDTLAGYTVIAVQTSENTICLHSDRKRLILQATESTTDHFLASADPDAVTAELIQLGLAGQFESGYTFVGPGTTKEQIILELEKTESTLRAAWNGICQARPMGPIPIQLEPAPFEY